MNDHVHPHDGDVLEAEVGSRRPDFDEERLARREAALRDVVKFGDPVLKSQALPVTRFDDELRREIARMGELMEASIGIGLAANQVGRLRSLLVYRLDDEGPIQALVNPMIEWASADSEWFEEGCLSLPQVYVDVERPIHVRVRAQDAEGAVLVIEASGLEARVIQHEMDHLDGVLILDRAPRDQRREAMRALRELDLA